MHSTNHQGHDPHEIDPAFILYWTPTTKDRDHLLKYRGNSSKVHAAIQIVTIRNTGRPIEDYDGVDIKALKVIANSLELNPIDTSYLKIHGTTASKQLSKIIEYLKLKEYSPTAKNRLMDWAILTIGSQKSDAVLIEEAEQYLRENSFILPAISTLKRDISSLRHSAENEIYQKIYRQLLDTQINRINTLTAVDQQRRTSDFQILKTPPSGTSSQSLRQILKRYGSLAAYGFIKKDFGIHQKTIRWIWELGRRYDVSEIRSFPKEKMFGICAVFLCEQSGYVLDQAVMVLDSYLNTMVNTARRQYEEKVAEARKASRAGLSRIIKTTESLLEAGASKDMSVADFLEEHNEDLIRDALKATDGFSKLDKRGFVNQLRSKHNSIVKFASLLYHLPFEASPGSGPTMAALEIQRKLSKKRNKKYPPDTPVDFVPSLYRQSASPFRKGSGWKIWEIYLVISIRDRLKSGDLFLTGSHNYQALWEQAGVKFNQSHHSKSQAKIEFEEIKKKLYEELENTLAIFVSGIEKNDFVEVKFDGSLKFSKDDGKAEDQELVQARKLLRSMMPKKVRIERLLAEVMELTGLEKSYGSIQGQSTRIEDFEKCLMAAIIAEGTNLGNEELAASADGISVDTLNRMSLWYLREGSHKQAIDSLVSFIRSLPISKMWGDGIRSSSDGQRFAFESKSGIGRTYPRYFGYYDKAFTIYTHVSDTYSVFSTQVITWHEREAVYVLNGILDADSSLDIKFHSTDTHGYTDILFGLMYLLGLSFQPRLADLSNVKLFFPSDFLLSEKFCEHRKIFSDKVNIDIIAEQWIELQKLKVALQSRIVPPDLMMQRLTKTVHADGLTKAVTALGRLVKTIWVLKYSADPEVRHLVRKQLNRGEERHSLAKRIFFANHGRVRTGDRMSLMNKASCLSLLSNAALVWNAWQMQNALEAMSKDQRDLVDKHLPRISPIMHEHIIPHGSYEFKTVTRTVH